MTTASDVWYGSRVVSTAIGNVNEKILPSIAVGRCSFLGCPILEEHIAMQSLVHFYVSYLTRYHALQRQLSATLDAIVTLVPTNAFDSHFVPTEPTVSQQLSHWPAAIDPLPPGAWVHPRSGTLLFDAEYWAYGFHGYGVSFTKLRTDQDVSIEYTARGEAGLTAWTLQMFLETLAIDEPLQPELVDQHAVLFQVCVNAGYIRAVPPLRVGCDQTYLLDTNVIEADSGGHGRPSSKDGSQD